MKINLPCLRKIGHWQRRESEGQKRISFFLVLNEMNSLYSEGRLQFNMCCLPMPGGAMSSLPMLIELMIFHHYHGYKAHSTR